MAQDSIKRGLPIDVGVYSIAPNATTNITLGGAFRGFAVITAYLNELKGIYIIGVNSAGNITRVVTATAASDISIPSSDASGTLKVTNSSSNEAKLFLFGMNAT